MLYVICENQLLRKNIAGANTCWSHLLRGRPIFFLVRRWCNQGSLHCSLSLLSLLPSLMLGTRCFSGKLTQMVSHSFVVSIPFLRLPEVAFDHGRNPFPGLTFPQVLLTQEKTQEDTHHPYQDVTSPDTAASYHFFSLYHQ